MFIKAICDGKKCYVNTDYIVDVFENETNADTVIAYTCTTDCEYIIDRKQFEMAICEMMVIETDEVPDLDEQLWASEAGIVKPTKISVVRHGRKK
jgi:hypothetical protein